jgi:hypothetical protein
MTDHHSFRKPNLEADTGTTREAFLSVRADGNVVAISSQAADCLGVEDGDYLHLALDRTRTPWVGVIDTPTNQDEPEVKRYASRSLHCNSSLMCRHLADAEGVKLGETRRFYLTGETTQDPDTGATLYQLSHR